MLQNQRRGAPSCQCMYPPSLQNIRSCSRTCSAASAGEILARGRDSQKPLPSVGGFRVQDFTNMVMAGMKQIQELNVSMMPIFRKELVSVQYGRDSDLSQLANHAHRGNRYPSRNAEIECRTSGSVVALISSTVRVSKIPLLGLGGRLVGTAPSARTTRISGASHSLARGRDSQRGPPAVSTPPSV